MWNPSIGTFGVPSSRCLSKYDCASIVICSLPKASLFFAQTQTASVFYPENTTMDTFDCTPRSSRLVVRSTKKVLRSYTRKMCFDGNFSGDALGPKLDASLSRAAKALRSKRPICSASHEFASSEPTTNGSVMRTSKSCTTFQT